MDGVVDYLATADFAEDVEQLEADLKKRKKKKKKKKNKSKSKSKEQKRIDSREGESISLI